MLAVIDKVGSIILLATCFGLAACGPASDAPGPVADEVYVIVPSEKTSSFTEDLALSVKKYGMTPNLGQATDDKGYSLYVLDATSVSVRLRSENVILSGQEEPARCGFYTEPHRALGNILFP